MFKQRWSAVVALLMIVIPGLGLAQQPAAPTPMEADVQSLLSAFASYTDLRIASVQRTLEVLASTSEAKSGEWGKMKALLSAYQKSDDGLIVWFVRPDGSYYTPDKGLVNAKLNDRSYFPGLMSGQKIVGSLVISKATGQRSAVIAVPMKEDGKVIGAIGASLFLDRLSDQIDAAFALRPDATFFALAPNGLTTLNRRTDLHFIDPREVGSETLKKAANEMLSNSAGVTVYAFEGVTKKAIYRTSPLTQWKFAIALRVAPQQ